MIHTKLKFAKEWSISLYEKFYCLDSLYSNYHKNSIFRCLVDFWYTLYKFYIWPLAYWLQCSPMVWETGVQSQVESYQRLKKKKKRRKKKKEGYLMPPGLTLSIIRYELRVKWINPGNGVVPSFTPWCSSYWKREPLGCPWLGLPTLLYIYIYIYIYICSQNIYIFWEHHLLKIHNESWKFLVVRTLAATT